MTVEEIAAFIESLGGVLTLRPQPGDGSPEIAWGDLFFYYAPDGVLPKSQPFATVVTKDYPDDAESRLDREGAFRVNVAAGTSQFFEFVGVPPGEAPTGPIDFSAEDVVIPHPVYGSLGWLSVVNPEAKSSVALRDLLSHAHGMAKRRHERRDGVGAS